MLLKAKPRRIGEQTVTTQEPSSDLAPESSENPFPQAETPNAPSKIPHPSSLPRLKTSGTTVSGTYFPCRRTAMRYLTNMRRRTYRIILPKQWSDSDGIEKSDIVWREDMEELVTGRMRDEVLGMLGYIAARGKGYIVGCEVGWEDVARKKQVGAVIWTGMQKEAGRASPNEEEKESQAAGAGMVVSDGNGGDESSSPSSDTTPTLSPPQPPANPHSDSPPPSPPPHYAMTTYKNTYIPVYNLLTLLSAERLQQLRAECPIFQNEILVIKSKLPTVKLQVALWRLMGYLAE